MKKMPNWRRRGHKKFAGNEENITHSEAESPHNKPFAKGWGTTRGVMEVGREGEEAGAGADG